MSGLMAVIGQGVGAQTTGDVDAAAQFSTILVAGVVGLAIIFQGVQSVALPLVTEFGYSKEIEDRVLAPLPVSLVAIEKIVAGMIQGLMSAIIVFPIAAFMPATSRRPLVAPQNDGQMDRRRFVQAMRRWLVRRTLAFGLVVVALAMGMVWVRLQVTEIGYQLSAARQMQERLEQQRR